MSSVPATHDTPSDHARSLNYVIKPASLRFQSPFREGVKKWPNYLLGALGLAMASPIRRCRLPGLFHAFHHDPPHPLRSRGPTLGSHLITLRVSSHTSLFSQSSRADRNFELLSRLPSPSTRSSTLRNFETRRLVDGGEN